MKRTRERGFVLALTILLVLGVTAISVGIIFNGRMAKMSAINYKNKIRTFMAADGMITLLAQELINGNAYKYVDTSRTGKIFGKLWTGIPGNNVAAFEGLSRTTPHTMYIKSLYLGSNRNLSDYGVKWAGWVIPPLTGAYTFVTRSDDESRFYLSRDQEEGNLSAAPICKVEPGWVVDWPTSGQAVSAPVPLEAGHRYYFEYYHKQGGGWDVGQVGWTGPEYFSERPISGQYLSQYKTDPVWSGTSMLGDVPVKYRVAAMGLDAFRISTEAFLTRPASPSDTAYRLPLTQSLSLKGPPIPPPTTMYMRVIYRDFPSGGAHPEFDMPGGGFLGHYTDMVQPTLRDSTTVDAAYFGKAFIRKPTHFKDTPNYGCGVEKWFKDWTPDNKDYEYATSSDCRKTKASPGTTYQHVKIYDSLPFTLNENQGPYTYVYSRMGNLNTGNALTSFRGEAEFFPLDWRGKDPAWTSHNYSFCLEMHTTFLHQSGLKFEFTGDDDVWVFLDNRRVIDLGGIHSSMNSILSLDDITWLEYGKTYSFDFFQCERHTVNSTSRIVTNLKMGRPYGKPVNNWRRDYGASN